MCLVRYEDSIPLFLQSILDYGESSDKLYNFGLCLYKNKLYHEAVESFEHALNLDPHHEQAKTSRDFVVSKLNQQASLMKPESPGRPSPAKNANAVIPA